LIIVTRRPQPSSPHCLLTHPQSEIELVSSYVDDDGMSLALMDDEIVFGNVVHLEVASLGETS